MFTKKRVAVALAALTIVGLGLFIYSTRHLTRLRLQGGLDKFVPMRDFVYVEGSQHPKHRLDVYMPPDAKDVPVIHFVHGGYWVEGDKDFFSVATGLYGTIGIALANKGVGAVIQSYRLAPEVQIDAIVDDVMRGLKWTQDNIQRYGGNPSRIFMMGHSAGGHLVSLVATNDELHKSRGMDPKALKGCIALSAVWDVVDMHAKHDADFNEQVTHATFGTDQSTYARYSPVTHFKKDMRPFLIMIGQDDFPYMIPQAKSAFEKMRELGNDPKLLEIPGNEHSDMVLRFGHAQDNMTAPVVAFVSADRTK